LISSGEGGRRGGESQASGSKRSSKILPQGYVGKFKEI